MISLIDPNATNLLSLALDAATMRQQAIAHNIANANTPGFRRSTVSFEAQLRALEGAGGQMRQPRGAELQSFRPTLSTATDAVPVEVDVEVAGLSQTVLHHQALLKALNKHFAILEIAVSEGKR